MIRSGYILNISLTIQILLNIFFAYQYNKWNRYCNPIEEKIQQCQMTGWVLRPVFASDESSRAIHRFFRSVTTRPTGCQ